MASLGFSGRTLSLKFKLDTYQSNTRDITPGGGYYFATADQLFKYGWALLEKEIHARNKAYDSGGPQKPVSRDLRLRLLGLKVRCERQAGRWSFADASAGV